jgi:hypothetical protein
VGLKLRLVGVARTTQDLRSGPDGSSGAAGKLLFHAHIGSEDSHWMPPLSTVFPPRATCVAPGDTDNGGIRRCPGDPADGFLPSQSALLGGVDDPGVGLNVDRVVVLRGDVNGIERPFDLHYPGGVEG